MSKYDVTIIGSGPGGYVAAIRCAQLGMKTAIIEKYTTLGGTCLNVGCIPSKALLDSSHHYHDAAHTFEKHGISTGKLAVDFGKMIERKNDVVNQTCDGIQFLMDKNKIDVYEGLGSFSDRNTIKVVGKEKPVTITTDKVIIATGSKPNFFPGMEPDKKRIITSTEALSLTEIPKNLIVIGGGVAANSEIRKQLNNIAKSKNWKVFLPSIAYSTDNAAMIGIAGYYKLLQKNYGSISDSPQARLKI